MTEGAPTFAAEEILHIAIMMEENTLLWQIAPHGPPPRANGYRMK